MCTPFAEQNVYYTPSTTTLATTTATRRALKEFSLLSVFSIPGLPFWPTPTPQRTCRFTSRVNWSDHYTIFTFLSTTTRRSNAAAGGKWETFIPQDRAKPSLDDAMIGGRNSAWYRWRDYNNCVHIGYLPGEHRNTDAPLSASTSSSSR